MNHLSDASLVCGKCGVSQADVKTVIDPYELEVNGVKREITLCGDCFQERLWDI